MITAETTNDLQGKTVFITGASRGIGAAIARQVASMGANVVLAAKSAEPHPTLPGTIHSVAEEVAALGAQALPIALDVRDVDAINDAVKQAAAHFGGIDCLVNNASALFLAPVEKTSAKRFDLIQQVNARGSFFCSQACLPFLRESNNPHILMLSPPLLIKSKWFSGNIGYTISKYGMSMCVMGMAEEFKQYSVAVNALWPKTTIATSAIKMNFPDKILQASRKDTIVAEAAAVILRQDAKQVSGEFLIDEDVLRAVGVEDFDQYAYGNAASLCPDFYIE